MTLSARTVIALILMLALLVIGAWTWRDIRLLEAPATVRDLVGIGIYARGCFVAIVAIGLAAAGYGVTATRPD